MPSVKADGIFIYFQCMNQISVNGTLQPGSEPALLAGNRGYRYGDGIFETMKIADGKIRFGSYHFERLFGGLALLKFKLPQNFTASKLEEEILNLCKLNDCIQLARVRFSVFRGHGGLYEGDDQLQYLIESWPLDPSANSLNEKGLVIDVYPVARKSWDTFSHLKSANFLPYAMAALHAKEHQLDDCLVLNTGGDIADSTIANVFMIKGNKLITPGMGEGCVNGVVRRIILEKTISIGELGLQIEQDSVSIDDILLADEVFLTNAINGIRWVKQMREKVYGKAKTTELYDLLFGAWNSSPHRNIET
jgi:branched-chain amino acid aminotransferase